MDRAGTAVLPLNGVDGRATTAVGREARLELVFERRGSRTVLAYAYAEPPLRVGRAFDEGDGVHLILASSAPGIFDGDTFVQRVTVGDGARVRLTSQSSLQVHSSQTDEPSRIRSVYDVGSGGELVCAWHPTIPFAGSHLDQAIDIRLAPDARLVWSDAVMSGRAARGEHWAFAALAHQLAVRRAGALEYLERWRVVPSVHASMTHPWVAAGCTHLGTVIRSGLPVSRAESEALHRRLDAQRDLHAAVDLLDDRLLLVRLMSASAVAFHEARSLCNL